MPFANYIGLAWKYGTPVYLPHRVIGETAVRERIFLAASLLTGIGLLLIKRWGWWLFVVASIGYTTYNIASFIEIPSRARHGPLIYTLLVIAAMIYFFRRDIFIPYLMKHRRGWRLLRRYPLEVAVRLDDREFTTENFGAGGFQIFWPGCPHRVNDEVELAFELGGEKLECGGGIAAITDSDRIGVAFRDLSREAKKKVERVLRESGKD